MCLVMRPRSQKSASSIDHGTLASSTNQPNRHASSMTLKGKTAGVTGSTAGIGLGIAHALAGEGANVVMNGLGSEKDNAKPIREVAAHGTRVAFDPANMLRHNQIADMIAKAERDFGSVDVLVNNAGIQHVATVE